MSKSVMVPVMLVETALTSQVTGRGPLRVSCDNGSGILATYHLGGCLGVGPLFCCNTRNVLLDLLRECLFHEKVDLVSNNFKEGVMCQVTMNEHEHE